MRNGNGELARTRQASREEDRIIVVAADMVRMDGERRGSTGNLERAGGGDRKVRVKAQHCHLFQPGIA